MAFAMTWIKWFIFFFFTIFVINVAPVLGLCHRDRALWLNEEKYIPLPPVLPGSPPSPLPLISYRWATTLLWEGASTHCPLWVSHHPPAGHQPGLYLSIHHTKVWQSSILEIHNQLSLLLKTEVKLWFRTRMHFSFSHTSLTLLGSIWTFNTWCS